MTCNQCCYSSIGRFSGAVKLHCGLIGCPLNEMPTSCDLGRREDAAAERYSFWREAESSDEASRLLLPTPR